MDTTRRSSRAHSGCQKCKRRKCDETKPRCLACTRGGYQCPGYGRPLRWSRKHELHSPASTSIPPHTARSHRVDPRSSTYIHTAPVQDSARAVPVLENPPLSVARVPDPAWHGLGLDPYDGGLAFEDATTLMSKDMTSLTPFIQPGPLDQSWPNHGRQGEAALLTPGDISASGACATEPDVSTLHLAHAPSDAGSTPYDNVDMTVSPGMETVNDEDCAPVVSQAQDIRNRPSSLLHIFYRLSSPRSLPALSEHDFVRYYFKHVSRLHSCFDSDLNPLRTLVASYWSESLTVSLTIQSMALAHIVNWYPYMAPLGITRRSQAWRSLQRDLRLLRHDHRNTEKVLLSLLLLGISANWLHSEDLGLQYLHITRNLIQAKLRRIPNRNAPDTLDDFWASALVHWEMVASFVDPVPITTFDGHGMPALDPYVTQHQKVLPHPLTGVGVNFHFALAEVGRVLRRRRQASDPSSNPTDPEHGAVELDQRWLGMLEKLLVTTQVPYSEDIFEFKDPMTSKYDLALMAKTCRNVGLLEIYRLSPEILRARRVSNLETEHFPFSFPDEHSGYYSALEWLLANLAMQTIDLIFNVPISSGASRLQPLFMVVCSSQLRLPDAMAFRDETQADEESGRRKYDDVTRYRYVVEARMVALSRKLPQSPMLLAMDIIREVWDKLDSGEDVHWMDVVHDNGWQTILL